MVSTHSQYLCPDYLSPLPTSADPGKSPLALLAATCNSIGAEPPSKSKSIQQAGTADKSTESSHRKETTSNGPSTSSSEKSKSVSSKHTCKSSPKASPVATTSERASSASASAIDENANKATSLAAVKPSTSSADCVDRPISAPTSASSVVPPSLPAAPPCFPTLPTGYPNPYAGLGLPAAFSGLYSHGFPGLGATYPNPYPSMSAASGFPRPCTDPLCKSCPPRPPAGQCLFGCTQCTHSPADLSMWLSYSSLLQHMPHSLGLPASLPLPMPPSTSLPSSEAAVKSLFGTTGNGCHVCSWLIKGTNQPCLKSFATAEQLVQHLKVHTQEDQQAKQAAPGGGRMSPRSMYLMSTMPGLRYQPYTLPKLAPSVSVPTSMPPMPNFPSLLNPYSLSALYAGQRLPGSLPHP